MGNSKRHSGFTVIELLVAMAVLVVMVMMMTRVFTETSRLWGQGASKATSALEGRAIMDFVVREMTQAIADDVVTFKINTHEHPDSFNHPRYGSIVYDDINADEVCFVAPVRLATGGDFTRNVHQFVYYVTTMENSAGRTMDYRYRLVRKRKTASMWTPKAGDPDLMGNLKRSAYRTNEWWTFMADQPVETVADNVVGFEIWAFAPNPPLGKTGYDHGFAYYSTNHLNRLPAWADVYLELLGDDEAKRAALLMKSDKEAAKDYISQNVRRFTSRVFFPNRERSLIMNN